MPSPKPTEIRAGGAVRLHRGTAPFLHRVLGAILLRRELYESVAADDAAWRPAAAVVCVTALAQNAARPPTALDHWLVEETGTWALLVLMLLGILRWLVYASVVHAVARLLNGPASQYRRLLRCLGFAEAPSLLILAGFLLEPRFFPWLRLAVGLWLLGATVIAVRAALATNTGRAAVVGGLGFVAYLLFPLLGAAFIATLGAP